MEEGLTQLGVGGIFVVLVLKMVFDFLGKRKNDCHRKLEEELRKLSRAIEKQTRLLEESSCG